MELSDEALLKCPRCDERLIVVVDEPMGTVLNCKCGCEVKIDYGQSISKDQLDGGKERV